MEANSTPTAPAPMIMSDFGTRLQIQNFDVGENEIGIGRQARQHARFRPGGDQNVLRVEHLRALIGPDFDLAGCL